MRIEDKKRYVFKKDYYMGSNPIREGREIISYQGVLYLDGMMIPEPYASDVRNLFKDDKFVDEYISVRDFDPYKRQGI